MEIVFDESETQRQGSDTLGYVPKGWENHPKYNPAAARQQVVEQVPPQPVYEPYISDGEVNYQLAVTPAAHRAMSSGLSVNRFQPIPSGRTVGEIMDEIETMNKEATALFEAIEALEATNHSSLTPLTQMAQEKLQQATEKLTKLRSQRCLVDYEEDHL